MLGGCVHPAVAVVLADGGGAIAVVFVILIIALVAYGVYADRKRRAELSAWAAGRGLVLSREKIRDLDKTYPNFGCLRYGDTRYAYNTVRGRLNGREMLGFDYHYVTGSGKNRQVHLFSAVILTSDVPLKPLLIRPENVFDKISEFFGADDIDFESAEFSRRFYVKSPDKRWAYDVIHARTMEFLLASPSFAMQFDRDRVICYRNGCFRPDDFEAACQLVAGVLDRLPEYLVRQQRQLDGAGEGVG